MTAPPGTPVATSKVATIGGPRAGLETGAVEAFVREQLTGVALDGRRVLVIVPDTTRTCPLPLLLGAVHGALHGRVAALTVLVALGTHAPVPDDVLARHVGGPETTRLADALPGTTVVNHAWHDPATFVELGTIDADRVAELTGGLMRQPVPVRINRLVVEHDVTLIVGPVFPHEVVGFSGGHKYLFPGVSGQEMIDATHWVGALITSASIIGTRATTPVRAMIDDAAALVPRDLRALCVVTGGGTSGLDAVAFGEPRAAWAAAADVSAETHVVHLDAPVRRVLSLVPPRYADLWTGAKGFYKVEPVVADGGEVVLHAPHITAISPEHPVIRQVGYHCRDYFLGQWDRFGHLPWGDLAHSTHLRGAGTWSPEGGEVCRVDVTLATGIPRGEVEEVGLRHLDPATIDVEEWAADPDTLVVRDAGEVLHRLRTPPRPARP